MNIAIVGTELVLQKWDRCHMDVDQAKIKIYWRNIPIYEPGLERDGIT